MTEDSNSFRQTFKYYKARKPPPDLSNVIDFDKLCGLDSANPTTVKCQDDVSICVLQEPSTPLPLGIKPASQWQAFQLSKHPGFVVILNPFEPGYQRYWIKRCLEDYHLPPNVTNLDAHMDRDEITQIFDIFVKKNMDELHKDDLLAKLRWVTLGYHYDWTAKKYYADKFTEFPRDLATLSSCIAEATGHRDFQAEAGIVNYYHLDSTLAGHTDHSEFDKTAPLMSVSFGQDAIFLLGGQTRDVAPTAMFLRSGDICVMGGGSRMAYHAVPRILLSSAAPPYLQDCQGETTAVPVQKCLGKTTQMTDRYSQGETTTVLDQNFHGETTAVPVQNCQGETNQKTDRYSQGETTTVLDRNFHGETTAVPAQNCQGETTEMAGRYSEGETTTMLDQNCPGQTTRISDQACNCTKISSYSLEGFIRREMMTLNWKPLAAFLKTSRINVNVRQVLKRGQEFPKDDSVVGSYSGCGDVNAPVVKRSKLDVG